MHQPQESSSIQSGLDRLSQASFISDFIGWIRESFADFVLG